MSFKLINVDDLTSTQDLELLISSIFEAGKVSPQDFERAVAKAAAAQVRKANASVQWPKDLAPPVRGGELDAAAKQERYGAFERGLPRR